MARAGGWRGQGQRSCGVGGVRGSGGPLHSVRSWGAVSPSDPGRALISQGAAGSNVSSALSLFRCQDPGHTAHLSVRMKYLGKSGSRCSVKGCRRTVHGRHAGDTRG